MATRFINTAIPRFWRVPLLLATIGALALAIAFTAYGAGVTQSSELVYDPWWGPHFHVDLWEAWWILEYPGPIYVS